MHNPDEKTRGSVEALATYGMPYKDIGLYLGISENTLKKYYMPELEKGKATSFKEVREFLFNAASGRALADKDKGATFRDCLTAAIFWGKTQMGMSEKTPDDEDQEKITKIEIVRREKKD